MNEVSMKAKPSRRLRSPAAVVARISEELRDAESFASQNAFYAAFLRFANVHSSLSVLTGKTKASFVGRCMAVPLGGEILDAVNRGMAESIARVRRILAVGQSWMYEEWVLILTSLIQVDLVSSFLSARGLQPRSSSDNLWAQICALSHRRSNRASFESASASLRRNWSLPVNHPFLLS